LTAETVTFNSSLVVGVGVALSVAGGHYVLHAQDPGIHVLLVLAAVSLLHTCWHGTDSTSRQQSRLTILHCLHTPM